MLNVYKHVEIILFAFATLVNAHFDKIVTTDSPKSHNPVKNMQCVFYKFCQLCSGNFCLLCWHYAYCFYIPIMLKIMLA